MPDFNTHPGNPLDTAIEIGGLAQNPYPFYKELRESFPVVWSTQWNCWILSRHADVVAALKDTERLSSEGRVIQGLRQELSEQDQAKIDPLLAHYSQGLIHSDPPDHSRMRRLIARTFMPGSLEKLKPEVHEIADELLDEISGRDSIEAIADYTFQIPIRVIARMMGIPNSMNEKFKEWSVGATEFMASPRPSLEVAERSQHALLELRAYFEEQFEDRRRNPGSDVISLLVAETDEGDKLTGEELQSTCTTILIGGHETTTSLLASALHILGKDQGLRRTMAANPSCWQGFVEETLRLEPPFQRILRVVKKPVKFHGHTFEPGQSVVLLLGSANRDENVFEDPDRLDPNRKNRRHVAFGHGVHLCLGAGLARLEAPIAIEKFVERFPHFETKFPEPEWRDGMIRCLSRLPLRLKQA